MSPNLFDREKFSVSDLLLFLSTDKQCCFKVTPQDLDNLEDNASSF